MQCSLRSSACDYWIMIIDRLANQGLGRGLSKNMYIIEASTTYFLGLCSKED